MEAPEKLYVDTNDNFSDSILYGYVENDKEDDIEYILKDAFIEKAQSFFRQSHYLFHLDGMDLHNFIEDFKSYMEE